MSVSSAPARTTSILLVCNLPILTEALVMVIRRQPDAPAVGVTDTCAAARACLKRTCPDVLLLDAALPNGLGLIPEISRQCPRASILVLTSYLDGATLGAALLAGVHGFVLKERPLSAAVATLRQAAGWIRRPGEPPWTCAYTLIAKGDAS